MRHSKNTKIFRRLFNDYKLEEMKGTAGNISGAQELTHSKKKKYNLPFRNIKPPPPFLWIWDSRCSNKLRSFTWLLMMDRLNTRNLLRRRNYSIEGNNYNCVLCSDNSEETAFHLFFSCNFSKSCWQTIGIEWRRNMNFFQMMKKAKQDFSHWLFMEVFIIASCLLGTYGNKEKVLFLKGEGHQ